MEVTLVQEQYATLTWALSVCANWLAFIGGVLVFRA
jgi:hypothetical protein